MSVAETGLSTGEYTKVPTVKLTVPTTDDDGQFTDVPDGFKRINDYLTRVDENGEPLRDADGNAGSVYPGEALCEYPDGSYLVIDDSNVEWFKRTYGVQEAQEPSVKSDGKPGSTSKTTAGK